MGGPAKAQPSKTPPFSHWFPNPRVGSPQVPNFFCSVCSQDTRSPLYPSPSRTLPFFLLQKAALGYSLNHQVPSNPKQKAAPENGMFSFAATIPILLACFDQ